MKRQREVENAGIEHITAEGVCANQPLSHSLKVAVIFNNDGKAAFDRMGDSVGAIEIDSMRKNHDFEYIRL